MIPVTMVDATGIDTFKEILHSFAARGVVLGMAGRQTEWQQWSEKRQFNLVCSGVRTFSTLTDAISVFRSETNLASVSDRTSGELTT